MINVYDEVKTNFIKPLASFDETDDEEDEKPEVIGMPELESEESTAQRREN